MLSTGVIGAPLPIERMLGGSRHRRRGALADGGGDAAEAILTTDTKTKTAVAHGDGFTVGGMAKGSGMIHPNLATMLAVVTTDYPLEPGDAIAFLRPAVESSFNAITVDGECSTNDAVVLLSSGVAQVERTPASDEAFALALRTRLRDLSRRSSPTAKARRCSPRSTSPALRATAEAKAIAQRIATSPLVKTALFGRDANWGRVLMAAGSAPFNGGYAQVDRDARLALRTTARAVLVDGAPQHVEPAGRRRGLHDRPRSRPRRRRRAAYLTSDLSYDYVRINAEYRS